MDNEIIAMALRMIGKNFLIIADCIHKEDEPAAVEEKLKKIISRSIFQQVIVVLFDNSVSMPSEV